METATSPTYGLCQESLPYPSHSAESIVRTITFTPVFILQITANITTVLAIESLEIYTYTD